MLSKLWLVTESTKPIVVAALDGKRYILLMKTRVAHVVLE